MKRKPTSHHDFLQTVSRVQHPELRDIHRHWLLNLAIWASADGSNARPGWSNVSEQIQRQRNVQRKYAAHCCKLGLIECVHEGKGRGDASVYRFCLEHPAYPDDYTSRKRASEKGFSREAVSEIKGLPETTKTASPDPEKGFSKHEKGLLEGSHHQPLINTTTTTTSNKNGVVGGIDEATTEDIVKKITAYFVIQFPEEVLLEKTDPIKELTRIHGDNTFEAWKLYLRDWIYPFTGPNKTKFPVRFFVEKFDQWLIKIEHGIRVIDKQEMTQDLIDATNNLAREAWHKSHPGWTVNADGDLVKVDGDEEPDPEALFEDENEHTH